jgi:hypothetical protein
MAWGSIDAAATMPGITVGSEHSLVVMGYCHADHRAVGEAISRLMRTINGSVVPLPRDAWASRFPRSPNDIRASSGLMAK